MFAVASPEITNIVFGANGSFHFYRQRPPDGDKDVASAEGKRKQPSSVSINIDLIWRHRCADDIIIQDHLGSGGEAPAANSGQSMNFFLGHFKH